MNARFAAGPPRPVRPRYAAIQRLRALAALSVLLFHALPLVGLQFRHASLGVDLFFVISGFLMVAITDQASRPGPFMVDRIVRIVPPYWLATAAAIVLATRQGAPPSPTEIAASLLFVPVGSPGTDGQFFPVLDVGWTLNYEMFFYLTFALTLFAPRHLRLPCLTGFYVALVAAGLLIQPTSAAPAFWTRPIILEFLAGAWVGAFWRAPRLPRPRLGWALIVAAPLLLLLGGVIGTWLGWPYPATRFRVAVPAAALLVGMLLIEDGGRRAGRWRPLTRLGDASYSIYLWHKPALALAAIVAARLGLDGGPKLLLVLASGLCAGVAAYVLIERPLLALFRRGRTRFGWPVPAGV